MKCPKDTAITVGLLLTVITIISGMAFNQIDSIQAEQNKLIPIVYTVPAMSDDIKEIKQDIKEIKQDIKTMISKP